MVPSVHCSTHPIPAYYSFIDPEKMKGCVGWPAVDGLPTTVVTHQLQDRKSWLARDWRSTTVPRNQPVLVYHS